MAFQVHRTSHQQSSTSSHHAAAKYDMLATSSSSSSKSSSVPSDNNGKKIIQWIVTIIFVSFVMMILVSKQNESNGMGNTMSSSSSSSTVGKRKVTVETFTTDEEDDNNKNDNNNDGAMKISIPQDQNDPNLGITTIMEQKPKKQQEQQQQESDDDQMMGTIRSSGKKDDDSNDDDDMMSTDDTSNAGNKNKNTNPIKQITILGERNSGTRWTYDHISECFNHSITVRKRLTRYKHWFQYDDPSEYPHDTLVLAQFRNPYDWLKAMEHVPHHAPAHLRTALVDDPHSLKSKSDSANDWKVFLTKPWTTERVGLDLEMNGDEICQENFHYKDIISCNLEPLPREYYNWTLRYSEQQPFYEMRNDGSGLPYDNIMEMRTDKIRNFLNVQNYDGVADVWIIQYEYLLKEGTQHLLDRIEEWTGITPECTAKESQNRPTKPSRMISSEFAKFLHENINWTVEEMIGYKPELKYEKE